jgi:hypothetical protein
MDAMVGAGGLGRGLVVAAAAPAGLNRQPVRAARRAALTTFRRPLNPPAEAGMPEALTLQIFSDYV